MQRARTEVLHRRPSKVGRSPYGHVGFGKGKGERETPWVTGKIEDPLIKRKRGAARGKKRTLKFFFANTTGGRWLLGKNTEKIVHKQRVV